MNRLTTKIPASPAAIQAEPENSRSTGLDLPPIRLRLLPSIPNPTFGLHEFKRELDRCHNMLELDAAFYEWFPQLRGTKEEQFEALAYTDGRLQELLTRCDPPSGRGGVDAEADYLPPVKRNRK